MACCLMLAFWGLQAPAWAQSDSLSAVALPKVRATEMGRPMKAALLSAVLPGAGQAYNRKYWKVPIVYAGVGGFAYAIRFNHGIYQDFRNALIVNLDGDPSTENVFPFDNYDNNGLRRVRDAYRRYRDLSMILGVVFYGLNIADAVVDAHLRDFDVSDDLSLRVLPAYLTVPGQSGAVWGMAVQVSF
jgi:hypothetical protein